MDYAFQLYSARAFQPWDEVLGLVAQAGYTQVEGYGGVYDHAGAIRALMDRNGLTMPSGHFSLDMLEGEFDQARRVADSLGVTLMVCPHLAADQRPVDASGWRSFAERLAGIGERVHQAGYAFAWHNHDFEFAPLPDGSIPHRLLLDTADKIGWEIDAAWMVRAGADPLAWIDAFADRIVAAHLKDVAPTGQAHDEDGWADFGHGTMDWPPLMGALRSRTRTTSFVMEHDNPSDIGRFARRSIAAARAL